MMLLERNKPRKVESNRYSGVVRNGRYRRWRSNVKMAMENKHKEKKIAEGIMVGGLRSSRSMRA
jgi:hypothetical protein